MNEKALIIFVKNLVYGKVKTRLAATIGNDKAMEIYKQLIQHSHDEVKEIDAYKIVFYSDEVVQDDIWKNDFNKQLQAGNDLGERMNNAFDFSFYNGYSKALIIGTDCPELNSEIITDAYNKLDDVDVVIGPAADGGYYLLGMKKNHAYLFQNIQWSSSTVLTETLIACAKNNLSVSQLKELHDVDEEKDLQYLNQF